MILNDLSKKNLYANFAHLKIIPNSVSIIFANYAKIIINYFFGETYIIDSNCCCCFFFVAEDLDIC